MLSPELFSRYLDVRSRLHEQQLTADFDVKLQEQLREQKVWQTRRVESCTHPHMHTTCVSLTTNPTRNIHEHTYTGQDKHSTSYVCWRPGKIGVEQFRVTAAVSQEVCDRKHSHPSMSCTKLQTRFHRKSNGKNTETKQKGQKVQTRKKKKKKEMKFKLREKKKNAEQSKTKLLKRREKKSHTPV